MSFGRTVAEEEPTTPLCGAQKQRPFALLLAAFDRGRSRASILADAFEALLAAMYLDGSAEVTEKFLLPMITAEVAEIIESGRVQDHKTELQQIIQQDKDELLEYVTVGEEGPPHKRVFTVEARLNGNIIGRGEGLSKRAAEQCAAKEALKLFGVRGGE